MSNNFSIQNVSVRESVNQSISAFNSDYINSLIPSGSVISFAGTSSPNGWLLCDGSTYNKREQLSLFSVIGYTYGGEGDNFCVPDLSGKVAFGVSNTMDLGTSGGSSTHTLTISELPSHEHSLNIYNNVGNNGISIGGTTEVVLPSAGPSAITGLTGGGNAFNILPPYLVLNYIIKT